MENGKTPKVSIIVPMYNVGDYAHPCLHSLMAQTYENLEIIVVNDGSTDETPAICRALLAADPRATVLDKENGGLSSARNFGLAHATGDFAMFVDGDDLLDRWAVGHLVALAQETGAKLVTCGFKKIGSTDEFADNETKSFRLISGKELLEMMLLLKGESGSACAKLYARDLFPLLCFPEGQLFEDFGVEAKIFASVTEVCVADAALYGYVTRGGSITTEKRYADAHLESMESSLKTVRDVVSQIPSLRDELLCFEAFCGLRVASRLDCAACRDSKAACDYVNSARKRCLWAARCARAGKTWRARSLLFSISPRLHNALFRLYGRFTGKTIS